MRISRLDLQHPSTAKETRQVTHFGITSDHTKAYKSKVESSTFLSNLHGLWSWNVVAVVVLDKNWSHFFSFLSSCSLTLMPLVVPGVQGSHPTVLRAPPRRPTGNFVKRRGLDSWFVMVGARCKFSQVFCRRRGGTYLPICHAKACLIFLWKERNLIDCRNRERERELE